MCARNGTRRTSRAGVDPGPPILTEKNYIKINIFPLNMACLVVDDAKCVPGMGRGAHPARTVSGPSHPDCKNKYKVSVVPLDMACLAVDDAKCVAKTGRNAHPARTSIQALPS